MMSKVISGHLDLLTGHVSLMTDGVDIGCFIILPPFNVVQPEIELQVNALLG